MTLYDTIFWKKLEGARSDLSGVHYYDTDYNVEHNIAAKNEQKYSAAYEYCYTAIYHFENICNTVEEIHLLIRFLKQTPEFSKANSRFQTDFIASYFYKDWIIRLNIIAEQIVPLTKSVYLLNYESTSNIFNELIKQPAVLGDKNLFQLLSRFLNFLKNIVLPKTSAKSIRQNRNEIIHDANFNHTEIANLSSQLFGYEMGLITNYDETDIFIDENITCINLTKEIEKVTNLLFEKIEPLFKLMAIRFTEKFNHIIQEA